MRTHGSAPAVFVSVAAAGFALVGCPSPSTPSSPCPSGRQCLMVGKLPTLGHAETDAGSLDQCTCDAMKRLELTIKSTCSTKPGIDVTILGADPLRVDDDLPRDAWKTVYTSGPLRIPRGLERIEAELHGTCSIGEEKVLGTYNCMMHSTGGCT